MLKGSTQGLVEPLNLIDELEANPQLMMLAMTPPVAFNPLFVDITGSVTAALFLSMCIQDMDDGHCDGGWSTLDFNRVHRLTRLSKGELLGARKRLTDLRLLLERRTGFPAQSEFRVDYRRMKQLLLELSKKPLAPVASTLPPVMH
jgi:hypothetical protein